MRFNFLMDMCKLNRLHLSFLLLLSPYCLASTNLLPENNNSEINIEEFEIRPLICVTQMLGNICELKIKINWRSNTNADYCVYQQSRLVKCWKNAQQGQHKETLTLVKNTSFNLQLLGNKNILAKQNIKINYTQSDTHRRRLRSQWSIF